METIKGFVKTYIFQNKENGYTIAKLESDNDVQTIIVGYFPTLNSEVEYEFTGDYVVHKSYGTQFKVETFKKIEIQSKQGLIQYLSSPIFAGIGPVTATKIIDTLGVNAIDLILEDHNVLKKVGFNAIKSKRLKEQLFEQKQHEHILISLYGYGLTPKVSVRLLNQYGHQTISKLEEDPFRLMFEVDGFGFIKAYEIAKKMNIPADDIRCVKAAIVYVLNRQASSHGDLYMTKDPLYDTVNHLLNIDFNYTEALEILEKEAKIIVENNEYYLSASYHAEIQIAQKVTDLMSQEQLLSNIDLDKALLEIEKSKGIAYTETQKNAIKTAISNPFSIITGGPGTGKTTIIDGLIDLYTEINNLKRKDETTEFKIALMAPTGRAAKRMNELLDMKAMTIHSRLGYDFDGSYAFDRENPLPHRLIIIDEASMIDVFLAKRLLDAISYQAQVIIVGDEDQLPSVGPGYFLGDLINSGVVPAVRLKEIHRQAKDSQIISLAQAVNAQKLEYEDLTTSGDIIISKGDIITSRDSILTSIDLLIKKGYSLHDDIQVLIPMYKGDLGIDLVNKLIQERFNESIKSGLKMTHLDKNYYVGDKVIQLVNDKDRKIMNGDIGKVSDIFYNNENKLVMKVAFDENNVLLLQQDLETINLAYAVSIHKSQGSEYPIVFLPIVRPYMMMLKKELIYTAITRAKKYLIMLGDMSLLKYATNQLVEKRLTKLVERLKHPGNKTEEDDNDGDFSPYDFM